MSSVEQARDVEIDRALVEIRQRVQQMNGYDLAVRRRIQEIDAHPVSVRALVWQTLAQALIAIAAAVGAGIAIAPFFHR